MYSGTDIKPHSEAIIHQQICGYLRAQYPDVIYRTDLGGSMKLTIGQAAKLHRLNGDRGYPDIFIAEPVGEYHGLFLEVKGLGSHELTTDGKWGNSKHAREQKKLLNMLSIKGYAARCVIGFDQGKYVIDQYMQGKLSGQYLIEVKEPKDDGQVF